MTNKATTASLSFLHPSVHQQNLSNKYANSSFLSLIFCHCLLWQQPLSWGQQENRTYWIREKRWQSANFITKPQLVKEIRTQVMCLPLLTAQMVHENKIKSHFGKGGIKKIKIKNPHHFTPLNMATYWQFSTTHKKKDNTWLFAKLAESLEKWFQHTSATAFSCSKASFFSSFLLLC